MQGAGENSMKNYPPERKNAILKKMLPPQNMSVAEVSRQEGISTASLYNWRTEARLKGVPVPGPNKTSAHWSGEAKFAVVVETAALSEAELSEYCREKGLYPDQVKEWKRECIAATSSSAERKKEEKKQANADKKQVYQLKKELRRKDKALAEAAALLVLRKKLNALYGEEVEGD